MKPQITLPNRAGQGANETLPSDNNVVIIGANGSGKTRLGAWIEATFQNSIAVHRISAQRALTIPEFAEVKNLEQAEKGLFVGMNSPDFNVTYKLSYRWANQPVTHMLNDYNELLSTLFARTTKRDREHAKETKAKGIYIPVIDAPIDIITLLWKDIMPHREISFEDGKIMARKEGQPLYHGKDMSDGERVTLYLIGQCLCAPDNSIVIIDEPETHLHKSLMARLWDKIEELCPTKLFIYITHDLDFAATRKEAIKLWIKSYDNRKWDWDYVPLIEEMPEDLIIEIIGNRKNIIFTEGTKTSYDSILYKAIFPEYYIVPRGSCDKVIESTKAIRGTPSLHHLKAYGIIDSDYRPAEEINALRVSGVYTTNVAEIENLFCIEPLLRMVASILGHNPDEIVQAVTDLIIGHMKTEVEVQVTNRAEKEIQFRLNAFTKSDDSEKGLMDGIDKMLKSIDVAKIYSINKQLYAQAVGEKNLEKALLLFNRKSLHKIISKVFGLRDGEYSNTILRLLKTEKRNEIINAVKKFIPTIE